ncbi:magnesium transporter [Edwardsiella piscicida]|nr:magnesium transporter [Edwardsiella piscicida]ELM3727990.1 magnesium transporter [Edwardsiella piscicida]ELV7536735.1 magnesium transporter [Edwardsiella piscicida]
MSATVTLSAEQRAQTRTRILQILLTEQAVSDGLLGRLDDPQLLNDPQLLDDSAEIRQAARTLPADDLSDILCALPCDRRLALWSQLSQGQQAQVLANGDPCLWPELTATLSDKALLQTLQSLPLERRITLGRQLPQPLTGRMLTLMEGEQRSRARTLLSYALHSVGAQMTLDTDTRSVRQDMALLLLLQWLRQRPPLPGGSDRLFVTDGNGRLCGELPLTTLLAAAPDGRVADIMLPPPQSLHPDDDALDAAAVLIRERRACVPVTDDKGMLLGQFNLIQAAQCLQRHHEQRLFRLAGLHQDEDLFAPITRSLRARALPLAGICALALSAALLSAGLSPLLGHWPMLALLLPLLMLLCANGAWQSAAVAQRALNRRHLLRANAAPIVVRELGVALLEGLFIGSLLGVVGGLYYQDAQIGSLVVLIAVVTMMLSALLGVQLPRLLAWLGGRQRQASMALIGTLSGSLACLLLLLLARLFLGGIA